MSDLTLQRLRIHGFRGLADPIELDLSNRLTVVYAPNGSGKTTLCDAVEWLLTGKVQRLCVGQTFDEQLLRSKFDLSLSPEVTGDFVSAGQAFKLKRAIGAVQLADEGASYQAVSVSELLELLAPEGAGRAHYKRTIPQRQEYLRGTRFLSSDTLAVLLDPADVDRRRQIFADVLGTRHLLEGQNKLERVEVELARTEAQLTEKLNSWLAEIAELERMGVAAPQIASTHALSSAERLLNLPPGGTSIEDRLERLKGAVASERQRLTQHRTWIGQLQIQLPLLAGLQQRLTEAEKASSAARSNQAELRAKIADMNEQLARARAELETQRQAAGRAAALRDRLQKTATAVEAAWQRAGRPADDLERHSFAELRDSTAEWRLSGMSSSDRKDELTAILAGVGAHRAREAEAERLETELQSVNGRIPAEEQITAGRQLLHSLESQLLELRNRLAARSEPVARLRAAALNVVSELEHGSDCPVCGHDWETTDNLKKAIEAFAAADPAATDLQTSVRRIEIEISKAKQAVEAVNLDLAARTNLARRLADLRAEGEAFRQRLSGALPTTDMAQVEQNATQAIADLNFAEAAASFETWRQDFVAAHPTAWSEEPFFRAAVTAALEWLTFTHSEALEGASQAAAQIQIQEIQSSTLGGEMSASALTLQALEAEQAQVRSQILTTQQTWAFLQQAENPSLQGLDRLAAQVQESDVALMEAERFEQAARASADAEARLALLEDLRRRVAEIKSEIALVGKQRTDAGSAKEAFRRQAANESKAQIAALRETANAIFARLHTNRVIDQIGSARGALDLLQWVGEADGKSIEPPELSHGQRQDLALSLFLARARSIGGSYLLDEPMAHLDDLNRVGLIDVFRSISLESGGLANLLVTTASRSLTRHLAEKFAAIQSPTVKGEAFALVELRGNPRAGVAAVLSP